MRKLLIFIFLYASLSLSGATYYISPGGSDSKGDGSIGNPWFTLNKAWNYIAAGDIVYMRGGTYGYSSPQNLTGKNGTSSNLIRILAYPGESPIITKGSGYPTSGYHNCIGILFTGNYFYWKGITITGFAQMDTYVTPGMWNENINHCTFDQMVFSYNGHGNWNQGSLDGNTWVNCDFHHNSDPLTSGDAYGNADGLGFQNSNSSSNNYITDCRFWWNSDDGVDFGNSDGQFIVDGCWSWYNGYMPGTFNLANQLGSGGNGIKTYQTPSSPSLDNSTKRIIKYCLVFHNVGGGISIEETNCISQIYNNTVYHNGEMGSQKNWQAGIQGWGSTMNVASVIRNNISYAHQYTSGNIANFGSNYIVSNNSWTGTVTDADFVSLSVTGSNDPSQARQSDGSLPVTTFLHLASNSGLIDKGIDVGLPFSGKAPDLGAFESQSGSTASSPSPVFLSSVVENSTPSLVEITYNMTLSNTIPSATSFTVIINSVARTVSSVGVTGTKVQLTLVNAIKYGDVVTVSYTKPATSPLQSALGAIAANISGQSVSNNLTNAAKDASPVSITMTISPNNVHNIINVLLQYSIPLTTLTTTALTPELIRISDLSGKLYVEKLVTTGITNIIIPINLDSGVYNVVVSAGGVEMSPKRLIVN